MPRRRLFVRFRGEADMHCQLALTGSGAFDPKRTWTGSSSRSAADLLGASVCATVGDGGTGVPMFAELHVLITGQADRDDGCGTSGRSEPEPSRSRLEAVRQAVGEIPRWGVSTEKASKRSKKMDFI